MKVFNFIRDIFKQFPRLLIFTIILLIAVNLLSACALLSLSPVTDFLLHPDLQGISPLTAKVIHVLEFFHLPVSLQSWLIIFVGFVFLSSVFQIFACFSVASIRYKMLGDVMLGTLKDFFNARWYFFSSEKQGVLLNTFTQEFRIFGAAFRPLAQLFSTALQIMVSLAIPFYISGKITFICFGVILVFSIPFWFLGKYSYKLGRLLTATSNVLTSVIHENLGLAKLMLGFGNQYYGLNKFSETFNAHRRVTIKAETLTIAIHLLYRPLAAFIIVVAVFAARFFNVSLSEIVVLIAALFQLALSVGKMTSNYNILRSSLPSYEQIEHLRKRARQMKQHSGGKKFMGFEREIILKNLSFAYPQHSRVLIDINMRIPKGKMIAFVGQSGAGKSTLIDIIMRFHEPVSGDILFDNIPLKDYDTHSYRQRIGYVPQDSVLFNMSVRDNLLWANPKVSDKELKDVCHMAYADEFIEKLPKGDDTLVGDRGVRLSGGQVQRIALARAFLRKPDLLILDEATSALDTQSERFIQKAIENFSKETTLIVVAHRLSTIKKADCIYVLDQGSVIEKGTYTQLSNDAKGYFNSMAQLQELEMVL